MNCVVDCGSNTWFTWTKHTQRVHTIHYRIAEIPHSYLQSSVLDKNNGIGKWIHFHAARRIPHTHHIASHVLHAHESVCFYGLVCQPTILYTRRIFDISQIKEGSRCFVGSTHENLPNNTHTQSSTTTTTTTSILLVSSAKFSHHIIIALVHLLRDVWRQSNELGVRFAISILRIHRVKCCPNEEAQPNNVNLYVVFHASCWDNTTRKYVPWMEISWMDMCRMCFAR